MESPARRVLVAATALIAAAWLLRGSLADALVLRGDDYLYAGDVRTAAQRYARALSLAPASEIAADRYAFAMLLERTPRSLSEGVRVTTAALARRRTALLLGDRALCYLAIRHYRNAYADFRGAAQISKSAQTYTFAGWSALHSGDAREAVRMWKSALAIAPAYGPARFALERHR